MTASTSRTRIDPVFLDTPQYDCEPLGDSLSCRIVLKVETLIPVRSFKGRGTETVLARLFESGATRSSCHWAPARSPRGWASR